MRGTCRVKADGVSILHEWGGRCSILWRGWGQLLWLVQMQCSSQWDLSLRTGTKRWHAGALVLWFVVACSGSGAVANEQGRVGVATVDDGIGTVQVSFAVAAVGGGVDVVVVAAIVFDVGVSIGAVGIVSDAGSVVGIAVAIKVTVSGCAGAIIAETWGGIDTKVGTAGGGGAGGRDNGSGGKRGSGSGTGAVAVVAEVGVGSSAGRAVAAATAVIALDVGVVAGGTGADSCVVVVVAAAICTAVKTAIAVVVVPVVVDSRNLIVEV